MIRTRVDDRNSWMTLDLADLDAPCYEVIARVGRQTEVEPPDPEFLFSADCDSDDERETSATRTSPGGATN